MIRQEGKVSFEQRITSSHPLSSFLFEQLVAKIDLSSPDGRSKLSTLALPLINKIPGETLRIYLRRQLGNNLGITSEHQLDKLLSVQVNSSVNYQTPTIKSTPMRLLIALLIQNPSLAKLVPNADKLKQITTPVCQYLLS